jgi:hypothetical protein
MGIGDWSGGLAFSGGGESDAHFAKKMRKKGRRLLGTELTRLTELFNQARGGLQSAQRQRLGGYDMALQEASRLGGASRRSALELGQQQQGAAQQGAISRGFSGAQATGQAGQIASQTARNVAAINEQLGQVFAGLHTRRGEAAAASEGSLAELSLRRFGAEKESYYDPLYNLVMGTQVQKGDPIQEWLNMMRGYTSTAAGIGSDVFSAFNPEAAMRAQGGR